MSKKHFIALADYLRDAEGYCEAFTPAQLDHLANFCHAQDCAFKRERWLDYIAGKCGKNGGFTLMASLFETPVLQTTLGFPEPLTEKYRPRTFDGFVGLEKIRVRRKRQRLRPNPPIASAPAGNARVHAGNRRGALVDRALRFINNAREADSPRRSALCAAICEGLLDRQHKE